MMTANRGAGCRRRSLATMAGARDDCGGAKQFGVSISWPRGCEDPCTAMAWYRSAATRLRGTPRTIWTDFLEGAGVPPDAREARFGFHWRCRKEPAARAIQYRPPAKRTGLGSTVDAAEGRALVTAGGRSGFAPAQDQLGWLYAHGTRAGRRRDGRRLVWGRPPRAYEPAESNWANWPIRPWPEAGHRRGEKMVPPSPRRRVGACAEWLVRTRRGARGQMSEYRPQRVEMPPVCALDKRESAAGKPRREVQMRDVAAIG